MLAAFIAFTSVIIVWTVVTVGFVLNTDWDRFRATLGDSRQKTIERQYRFYKQKNWFDTDA